MDIILYDEAIPQTHTTFQCHTIAYSHAAFDKSVTAYIPVSPDNSSFEDVSQRPDTRARAHSSTVVYQRTRMPIEVLHKILVKK